LGFCSRPKSGCSRLGRGCGEGGGEERLNAKGAFLHATPTPDTLLKSQRPPWERPRRMNHPRFLPPPGPRSRCRGFELDADGNPQTGISVQIGLNQPITACGGPLREDGGGMGAATGGPLLAKGARRQACSQRRSGRGGVSL
jgi:hypothetical protein